MHRHKAVLSQLVSRKKRKWRVMYHINNNKLYNSLPLTVSARSVLPAKKRS